ncbi:alkylation response protein AidB-like acyl-CoA dehydrogenase [Pseudonocardia sediminis]|uniref:Alkylation response protein AidB-like acyl-CoA dehydrogenase n=1 Tax=Pseudonocardia sediminis TaxID=1397368 RepID=A0A4Q7UUF0_PSEST|nr:acyl-CoA dehydrogenase family protein [Pseudonocardia sediminis]RZT84538.1 alkylation response protein AidB-like acyl-CoA dehydrogenase [Pseudonocardia sediminis]
MTATHSPVVDLFAPSPELAAHPAVAAARTICDDVLAPHAVEADDPARGVTASALGRVAGAGLISVTMPEDEGGFGGTPRVEAEVVELLAGTCAATWFVGTQHRTPQQFSRGGPRGLDDGDVVLGPAAERHRTGLASAREKAGIAVAHLRRPGRPAVTAEPEGTGWRLRGRADWCTGWGLVDLVMIGATTADDRYLFVLVPARSAPGLRAGEPLPLTVMGGTRTVALEFDDLAVAADDVLADVRGAGFREQDLARTANTTPASMGLLRRVLTELDALGRERDRPEASELATELAGVAVERRAEAYALLTGVPLHERVRERVALRGELGALTVRAAQALVAARSGSALLATSPEQRWAREAAFHMVQAQTEPVRRAQLEALGR